MNKKTYLSITGTTGAGKSTLLSALNSSIPINSTIIKQTTCRFKRDDDNINAFSYIKEEEFKNEKFFICSDRYGITEKNYKLFLSSKIPLGMSINGVAELQQLSEKKLELSQECNVINVLITHTSSLEDELLSLRSSVDRLFSPEQANSRFECHRDLCKNYFFNSDFLKQHIDIHLKKNETIENWANQISLILTDYQFDSLAFQTDFEKEVNNSKRGFTCK